jgi:hypothetical protein
MGEAGNLVFLQPLPLAAKLGGSTQPLDITAAQGDRGGSRGRGHVRRELQVWPHAVDDDGRQLHPGPVLEVEGGIGRLVDSRVPLEVSRFEMRRSPWLSR